MIVYERNTTVSDQNLFDIYKCNAAALIKKFWSLNKAITRSYRAKHGTWISKDLVKQAIADEQAGLVND